MAWESVLDDESGDYFYYNTETGECQWEIPEEYSGGTTGWAPDPEALARMKAAFSLLGAPSKAEEQRKIEEAKRKQLEKQAGSKMLWVECYDPGSEDYYVSPLPAQTEFMAVP